MDQENKEALLAGVIESAYTPTEMAGLIAELSHVLEVDGWPSPKNKMEKAFFFNEMVRVARESKRHAGRLWDIKGALERALR